MDLDRFNFPTNASTVTLPFLTLNFQKPTDGYPPFCQWQKWSDAIWHGFEKDREPFEVYPDRINPGDPLDLTSVRLVKGYTRGFGVIETLIQDQASLTEPERCERLVGGFSEASWGILRGLLGDSKRLLGGF